MELETQLLITERVGYASMPTVEPLLTNSGEVGRMLNGLRRSLGD